MKKILTIIAVAFLTAMTANARRIRVVDSEGQPIPFATILNAEGAMIGVTDIEGFSDDLHDINKVIVNHVAFKSKAVNVVSDRQQVTLEDADYTMPEITVAPKPYTYMQVYYRMVVIRKDGVLYYRTGLVDNFYNEEKGKQESSKQHFTRSIPGLKMPGNIIASYIIDHKATFRLKPAEQTILERYKQQGLKFVSQGDGKKLIIDNYCPLGSITDLGGRRRISFDFHQAWVNELKAEGNTKKLEKQRKREAKVENVVKSSFVAYSIDSEGQYRPEDFLMERHLFSGDSKKYGHCIFVMDFFATDRSYVTKEGMKAIKKANKTKMSYEWAQQFEREHNIPPLTPEIATKVRRLAAKD